MGAYLSEPVLEKHSEDGDAEFLSFGSSSMQGWRVSQEVLVSFLNIVLFSALCPRVSNSKIHKITLNILF